MKSNMKKAMDRMKIDEGARHLIRQMWKHGYKTKFSCSGHYCEKRIDVHEPYIVFSAGTGDGWFEKNAAEFGLHYWREDHYYKKNFSEGLKDAEKKGQKVYYGAKGAAIRGTASFPLEFIGEGK